MCRCDAFLKFVFFYAVIGLISGSAYADTPPLHQLNEISSDHGILNATLEAREQKVDLGGVSFEGMTFNGDYAGPLLRVHPGDVMHIHLINHLSEKTNLHFHGFHASPLGKGDNIFAFADPGNTLDYIVKISPHQPPGLFWYHTHIHGLTDNQDNKGLSGGLLVEGFAQQMPALAQTNEQILILKQYSVDETTDPALQNLHKFVQTINGQLLSSIPMRKGETQLWHIGNHGADLTFHLSLQGHKFRIIGRDGVSANKETLVDRLDIGPASRLEVLVDAGDKAGSFDIVSEGAPVGRGADLKDNRVLGSIVVGDGNAVAGVPEIKSFPTKPDLRKSKIDAQRTVVFSENAMEGKYFVNGQLFDHDRLDTRVALGTVEEWTIRNDTDDMHVFHIHQMHFQIDEINGQKQDFDGYMDTIRVPERGEVKLIIPFTDPIIVGKFVYHCHVLEHEDKGMMGSIEVYDPKKETSLSRFWLAVEPRIGKARRICGERAQSLVERVQAWL